MIRRPGWRRSAVRLWTVAVWVAVAMVGSTSPAFGHAAIVASQPSAGSNLAAAPGVVTVRFSEPLIAELSRVTVVDPLGRTFTSSLSGERELAVDVDSTTQGIYLVEWKTVSPIDGHTLQGSFEFGVGAEARLHSDPSTAPSGSDLVIAGSRTVEYVGLLGALGLLSLASLAVGASLPWRPTGLHRWVAVAAAGGAGTVLGELALASDGSIPSAAGAFLFTSSGWPRLVRLVAETTAVTVTWRAARAAGDGTVPRRSARVMATLLTLVSLVALAASGHAAAGGGLGVMVDAGHLWAAGVWAGSIVVMLVHRPPDGWRGETGTNLLREFSPIAISTFAATVVLGSARGWQELSTVSDLWTTDYGRVLYAKVVAVLAMVLLSARAWRRRSHARTEGTLAVAVITMAAVLAAFPVPPGRGGDLLADQSARETQGLPTDGDLTLAQEAGNTVVGVSIRPGTPGINDVFVHLVPPGGTANAEAVTVRITPPEAPTTLMRSCGTACRVATVPLSGGQRIEFEVGGAEGGTAAVALPALPASDGSALAAAATARMQQVSALRYDEIFGPVDPPITSTWEIITPDRIHGTITGGSDYHEITRIADVRWTRRSPDGQWEGGEPGDPVVQVNRFIWDAPDKVAARIVGEETIEGVATRIVTFFIDVSGLPVWYRLWIDQDDLVRQAHMRTQGHFMDHRYYDFDLPITVEPPV